MSLLLEALKKAEKAKEEAQRRASGAPAAEPGRDPAPARSELRLQDDVPQAAEAKPVMTRAELPDISPSLEILSDDIATPKASAAAASRRPPAREPDSAARRASPQGSERTTEQASARKVFEAKFKEPNPRMPFYLTMGALGLAAVCTIGYFWYQLRPPAPLVNANPPASGAVASVAAASPGAPLPAPAASPAAAAPAAIPGLPSGSALPPAPASAAAPSAPASPARASSPTPAVPRASATTPAQLVARSTPAPVARAPGPAARATEAEPASPVVSRQAPQVLPQVQSGYTAFLAGDLLRARTDYEEALREEPANRDALLGLAAIDIRTGRYEAAEATYLNLLRADPRDAHAQAGLLSLRGARMDPLAAESRVKTLLAADPQAQVLHFTLGNQFAQQGRWGEAQQEYFKAFAAEPDNADFAYNLAVSLDHLRQSKPALEYYQRALSLAAARAGSFDPAAARARIAQLGR